MARGARKADHEKHRYIGPVNVPAAPKPTVLTEAIVKSVSLLLPPPRKKALLAGFDVLMDVVTAVLRAPDPPEVTDILNASEERANAALQFIWSALAEYDPRALDQLVRKHMDEYLSGGSGPRPPRIRQEAKSAHDNAFKLIAASRIRARLFRKEGHELPEQLSRRITRVVIDVEVLSLAVMMAMTRARRARNLDLLEGIIFALFNASMYLYAFVGEAASIAALPPGGERRVVIEFRSQASTFILREAVDVDVVPDGERFTASLHVVPLSSEGPTTEEAVAGLAEHFAATWDALVNTSEDDLSLDALAMRARLNELVEVVEAR